MRLAIITLPFRYNYGGIVQAYALQTILQRMGHDVTIIDYENRRYVNWFRFPLTFCKRLFKRYIIGDGSSKLFIEADYNKEALIKSQNITPFINRYFPKRQYIRNFNKDIANNEFDGFVVGSDQVWKPGHFTWLFQTEMSNAYLGFAEGWNVKRIAYAVSFGVSEWDYTEEQSVECKRLSHFFDGVSVREDSGVRLCKENLDVNALHVLDPTMLLSKSDYVRLIVGNGVSQHNGGLFEYILDKTKEKDEIVACVAKERGLDVFESNSRVDDLDASLEEQIQPPIEYWLQGFNDADFVVTDSFHGTVFSIIFNKPFVTIANADRGLDRFTSLLKIFGLENRLVTSVNDITCQHLAAVDYSRINNVIADWQRKSMTFLSNALSVNQ